MTVHHCSTPERHGVCPLCGTCMDLRRLAEGTRYVCRRPGCFTILPVKRARLTEVREIVTAGYTCRYCAHPMRAALMATGSVICYCMRCGRRNETQAAWLAELEAERARRERQECEDRHQAWQRSGVPYWRGNAKCLAASDHPLAARPAVIRANRTENRVAAVRAKLARDAEGHYYCVVHRRALWHCDWGFYCPIGGCGCVVRL